MRFLVLWILAYYPCLDQALGKEFLDLPEPDFTDYENVPENNFSIYFNKNTEEKNQNYIEPLTPIGQDMEKLQETTATYGPGTEINNEFLIVSDTKNAVLTSGNLYEEYNGVSYTSLIQMRHTHENTAESGSVISQDLILSTEKLEDNFHITEYQNDDLQYTVSEQVRQARTLRDRCLPWPVCESWKSIANLTETPRKKRGPVPQNALPPAILNVIPPAGFNVPPAGLNVIPPAGLNVVPPAGFKKQLDIPSLIIMVNEVAFNYSKKFNLLNQFHDSLAKFDIPTCEPLPTTPTPIPTTTINFNDARLVAKCFVCGLKDEGIPRTTACSDAFAADFIPLAKLDLIARGQVASFRKYCRYLNVPNHMDTPEEPQSTFGRFTGGCSVRWTDLSGAYTQRTCRNQRRATTGKHFASKRMAKLEMALTDQENGCIVSPMASLIPVSRGISVYARFYACVCTGSWCNGADLPQKSITTHIFLILITTFYS